MEKINVLSLFSGIGAWEKALERIGVPYNLVNYCEIDSCTAKAFSLIHNVPQEKNLVDVSKVDTSKITEKVDLITYSFPCQDISSAGKKKGLVDKETGEITRSGLFFEALKIIKDLKPKYAIAENVKNLVGSSFKEEFKTVLKSLEDIGYVNYWKVLNSKDYGIPQSRDRVFIVSIRKDLDDFRFRFPQPFPLNTRLRDVLEDNVDACFVKTGPRIDKFLNKLLEEKVISLTENGYEIYDKYKGAFNIKPSINEIGNIIEDSNWKSPQRGRIYSSDGVSPTLNTAQGGGLVPKILEVDNAVRIHYLGNLSERKTFSKPAEGRVLGVDGISYTLLAHGGNQPKIIEKVKDLSIRQLTPKECFRLMGFDDKDVDILTSNGIANSRLYKMAGNSIVVNVLEELFKSLFRL